MTNNTNRGPAEGGLPSLGLLLPPWVSDDVETTQVCFPYSFNEWLARQPLMASPCRPLALFLEGIHFMDPILDGEREVTERKEGDSCRAASSPLSPGSPVPAFQTL